MVHDAALKIVDSVVLALVEVAILMHLACAGVTVEDISCHLRESRLNVI